VARAKRKRGQPDQVVATAPAKVLVVNDDDDACELLCRLLARAGYVADRAVSHDQALAQVAFLRPQCVVLDLSTGGIGQNLKLLDAIRSNVEPAIATSRCVLVAQGTNNQLFSWQAGIDAFMVRPFHADELLRHVAEAIARPDAERPRHRRKQLDEASAAGRQINTGSWTGTQRF
jgi:DNA-binding response OmpR family regulator